MNPQSNEIHSLIGRACRMNAGLLLLAGSMLMIPLGSARAERLKGEGELVAVNAKIADDYVRVKLPDGKFKQEIYALGEGGIWGGKQDDYSFDKVRFAEVAKTIAVPLAQQGYVTGKNPKDTQLLIMVYWGTTAGSNDFSRGITQHVADGLKGLSAEKAPASLADRLKSTNSTFNDFQLLQLGLYNQMRDRASFENGEMMGYGDELIRTKNMRMTALNQRRVDLLEELEKNRYFVVLMAYDFQLMWKQKKAKLLWETRYSINQRGNEFDLQLADMTKQASKFFGQDSGGLLRKPLPGVRVDIGNSTLVGFEDKAQ